MSETQTPAAPVAPEKLSILDRLKVLVVDAEHERAISALESEKKVKLVALEEENNIDVLVNRMKAAL